MAAVPGVVRAAASVPGASAADDGAPPSAETAPARAAERVSPVGSSDDGESGGDDATPREDAAGPVAVVREPDAAAASAVASSGSSASRAGRAADAPLTAPVIDADFDDERALSPARRRHFERCLSAERVEVSELRRLSWSGVPHRFRARTWQHLLGYRPAESSSVASTLARRRAEYREDSRRHFRAKSGSGVWRTESEQRILRQVLVDVPRTLPSTPLIHTPAVQRALERLLFLWAVRHPASGYVQGMNDIAAPLLLVFLAHHAGAGCKDTSAVPKAALLAAEADVFHCLTRLLDGLQDHYTPDQPGIQRVLHRLRELLLRIDRPLVEHIEAQGFTLMQLVFPWINCLLLRELPLGLALRLWDTYFAEGGGEGGAGAGGDGFEHFHTYVCAAILAHFSAELREREKTDMVEFVQSLPTRSWRTRDLEATVAQAYIYKSSFEGAEGHLA
ncbi:hypothetical protein FNF29_04397 [Cafeteria roenbergensis]|uniref:Rab-GAP TBC domain-containing protein n=1 Tax=Cafeteria roenbergensis TaxID=33653 RepID=A0A5A8CHW6_CAFRO|nr:hypothetical protein FNF29_04397 [Cafeteria roenbergensis]|eukprot:KAA0151710.1 hypothetical protein FNF29_04397 [Cafeteria roenbergensis]